jgi:hypothetical protein
LASPRHFIIAGAQRAGTTGLCERIARHPEIQMAQPLVPEPKYFLGAGSESSDLADYRRRLFSPLRAPVCGEKTVSYMDHPDAPRRIQRLLPDAHIVFVLRDPVERALSNYWFSVANGIETLSLREALLRETEGVPRPHDPRLSMSPYAYLERGHYVRSLERWERFFPRPQLVILLFEELLSGERALDRLFAALRVAPGLPPSPPAAAPNAARREAGPADAEIAEALRGHFEASNRELSVRFDLDLECWSGVPRGTALDTA